MLERFAARVITSPFAVFVCWTIDLAFLIRELRRERRQSVSGF
jgi:hypothetical protein